ncbi:MAG: DUF2156 domain-containing protein [Clostridia bacterium]|nr:DUF2156 domain-containing protein [Clostridia bacterium]
MVHTRSCDYSIGGMFMWRDYYRMEYSIENGVFFSRLYDKNGKCYYNIPIGQDIKRCIRKLIKEEGKLAFCTVPESMLEVFKSLDFTINVIEQPDFADYLYNSSDLIHLRGKKLSSKRNQIHQFLRENDLWSYETISDDIIQEIKVFLTTEYKIANNAKDFEIEEERKVLEVLDNYNIYNFVGSVLKVDDKIVGFSIGEIVGDTLFVHIEKANNTIKGVYQMLVNLFAIKYSSDKIQFINREEDMGDVGLRISKKSYHPVMLINKYIVEVE